MINLKNFIIIAITSLSFLANSSEIKEIKVLDDISNEILGETKKINKNNKENNKIEKINKNEKFEEDTANTKINLEKVDEQVNKNDIIDIYEKDTRDGIVYRIDEEKPFTGIFGVVLEDRIEYYEKYKNGLLDGETAWYSKNGVKLLSENYSASKLDGPQKTYYENGNLKSIIKYKNNRVAGIIFYDIDGKVLHRSDFVDGTGVWKLYWSNGKIFEEGKYVKYARDGVWKRYRKDGSIDTITEYKNGRKIKERWE